MKLRYFILWSALALSASATSALAQQMSFSQTAAPPIQPGYVAPAPAIPPLPQSRACTTKDVPGIWKLQRVYEAPVGMETSAFLTTPIQYMLFDANSIYAKYNAGNTELTPNMLRAQIKSHASGLQQYIVDASGFVFFYQDKAPTDTQACFIVVNSLGQFLAGQMLLMPPEGQIQGRLVKVYGRVNEQQPGQQRRR